MKAYWKDVRDALAGNAMGKIPVLKQERMMTFVSGALIGLVAGAILAVMLAPSSGAELREKLAGKAKQIAGRTSERVNAASIS